VTPAKTIVTATAKAVPMRPRFGPLNDVTIRGIVHPPGFARSSLIKSVARAHLRDGKSSVKSTTPFPSAAFAGLH